MTKKSIIVCDVCGREIGNTHYWEAHSIYRDAVRTASTVSHVCPDCWEALVQVGLERRKKDDAAQGGVVGPFPMGL